MQLWRALAIPVVVHAITQNGERPHERAEHQDESGANEWAAHVVQARTSVGIALFEFLRVRGEATMSDLLPCCPWQAMS
jgi:hypothetical protein